MDRARSYAEKLRDPRWQRKRLEVLSASDFSCQDCGAKDKELHVHHLYYARGKDPWDYPSSLLRSLCADCHEIIQADRESLIATFTSLPPALRIKLLALSEFLDMTQAFDGVVDGHTQEFRESFASLHLAVERYLRASGTNGET